MPISDAVLISTRAKASGMALAEAPLFENLAISPDAVVDDANEATRFWGAAVAVGKFKHDIDAVIRRFRLGVGHAELEFYSNQSASTYLNLLPGDFNSLADANVAEREAETRVNVRKAQSVNRVIAKIRKLRKWFVILILCYYFTLIFK